MVRHIAQISKPGPVRNAASAMDQEIPAPPQRHGILLDIDPPIKRRRQLAPG
jgi:hypothetical protein